MSPLGIWADGPEYVYRRTHDFCPQDIDICVLRKAIPPEAFRKDTVKALFYAFRIVAMSISLLLAATYIDPVCKLATASFWIQQTLRWTLLAIYWTCQSVLWAGLWSVGHEAGHNNISSTTWINHTVGFIAHSMIFLPYFSFKITHLRHHKTTSHLDKEEVYVPYLRSDFPLPSAQEATPKDYMDVFEETPIVTLCRFLIMQFLGLHTYLTWNTMGSKRYPIGSNHWNPKSGLFTNEEYAQVMISNIGMMAMVALLYLTARLSSVSVVVVHYFVPFVLTNHWVVAMTFLQHSCSTVPYYRGEAWSRTKGALSTVDRPFLGYVGKFILLGVNHYHTTHHLFASIPFYNLPMAHAAIRPLLGDMYNYDSTGVFRALWRSFNECIFVESEGAIVFFKDTQGNAKRNVKVLGGDPSRA